MQLPVRGETKLFIGHSHSARNTHICSHQHGGAPDSLSFLPLAALGRPQPTSPEISPLLPAPSFTLVSAEVLAFYCQQSTGSSGQFPLCLPEGAREAERWDRYQHPARLFLPKVTRALERSSPTAVRGSSSLVSARATLDSQLLP